MNKRHLALLIFSLMQLSLIFAQTGSVTINISEIKNNKGIIWIGLFDSPKGFPDKDNCFEGVQIKAKKNEVIHIFSHIPKGQYAIATWHDEDENGIMNKNLFGVPKEYYGFSLNKYGIFGPPEFESVKFEVNDNQHIELNINLQ